MQPRLSRPVRLPRCGGRSGGHPAAPARWWSRASPAARTPRPAGANSGQSPLSVCSESEEPDRIKTKKVIEWAPLNVITDNGINQLIESYLSRLTSPKLVFHI